MSKDDVDIERERLHKIADGLTVLDRVHFTMKDLPMDDGGRYQQINIVVEKNINVRSRKALPEPPRLDPETNLPALPDFWEDEDGES